MSRSIRLFLVALLASMLVSAAQANDEQPLTKAPQAILMDAESGAILLQRDADKLVPPASMSKLMLLAVVFKALKSGQLKGDDQFVMSVNAWRKGGAPSGTSAMFVPVNTREPLLELIKGITVQSGNDAAIAIAEGIAGSEANFAKIMTAEARRPGLQKSTFANATGLYHPEHLMTMREAALLARYLIKEYPSFYPLFAEKEYAYRKHKFINRNPLLFLDIGADGLKTGHIKEAGYGIVASAQKDGRRLILAINGMPTAQARKDEARRLLEWGFRSFATFKLFTADEIVGQARVWGGSSLFVPLKGGADGVTIVLPRFPANQKIRADILYKGPLKPPIKRGDQVATLRVTSSTDAMNEVPLYAGEDVERGSVVRRGLDSLFHLGLRMLPL